LLINKEVAYVVDSNAIPLAIIICEIGNINSILKKKLVVAFVGSVFTISTISGFLFFKGGEIMSILKSLEVKEDVKPLEDQKK
jgi:hypothetical protein